MDNNRLEKLVNTLRSENVDALVIVAGISLTYLTSLDFHLSERPIFAIFHREGQAAFVVPWLERLKPETAGIASDSVFTFTDEQGPAAALQAAIRSLPEMRSVGVEYLTMRVLEYRMLQQILPTSLFIDGAGSMDALRLHKDADEIKAHRKAVAISEAALELTLKEIRTGMTEKEIAAKLSGHMRSLGGDKEMFEPIVLGGSNTANPHGIPGDYKLKEKDILLIDFGTSVDGYVSDITRTFFMGEPTDEMMLVYQTVRKANETGQMSIKPGKPCGSIDAAARQVIESAGYGEAFTHRTGHGIGREIHERPYILAGNDQVLSPGMTFTIEPGIYLDGKFGIRIEDNVVVTEQGVECLTSFSRDLRIINR